jgi:hypothetical protein
MQEATQLWAWWQALCAPFAAVFTRQGWVRFVQWVTGTVLCWEEHTLTQILTALALEPRWSILPNMVRGTAKRWNPGSRGSGRVRGFFTQTGFKPL